MWLGYAIAPLFGPLLYGIIILFFPEFTEKNEFSAFTWLGSLLFFTFVSYIICLISGIPLIKFLKKINKLNLYWVVALGSIVYAISLYIVLFYIMGVEIMGNPLNLKIKILLVGFGLGIVVTSIFYKLSGITTRPEVDNK